METTEHGARVVYPIQFMEQEALGRLPIPLVRVSLCGMIKLEVLIEVVSSDPPLGRYQVIAPHILRGRGAVPSLMLLKLLGSQPHRFAPKDWLATQMKHEMERGALVRLDTIASQLRKQFRGFQGQEASALGLLLVSYLRNGRGSGPGYQLAPYPLIWLDTEALAFHVEQAARMERFGQSQGALPFWQRAYALASRGEYLPDDLYSEWATDTRAQVQGALRQSVHALSRLSLSLHGQQGKEEVIALLRNYWLAHQSDEDALRPLMELLGERERYQEAEAYYQQLCEALDAIESGKQPDERTRDIREFLRARQIQRPPVEEERFASSSAGQQQTQVVEAIGYPLSDNQHLLLVADEHSEHTGPLDAETRHLLGRQEWLASVIALIEAQIPKKLLVLHGPIGVGKSSELNRLAHSFREHNASPYQVMVLPLPSGERHDPEVALDLFVGMLLSSSHPAPFPADASRQTRIKLALTALAQRGQPTMILLDNAEGTLTEEGTLAPCWEAFLTCVVRGQHQATLVLASKEWPGWPGRDPQLVAEIPVPPLTLEDSVLLLQRLGLESVPHAALETISQRVACIPLCLEWIATIAHDPLVQDEWEGFEEQEESSPESRLDAIAQRLVRLLKHPTLLGEHLASRLTPLLEHIIERHLSADARRVLEHLAMVSIPLGKPALQVFCSRPAWLKELRSASLLAAYTNRIQVLPTVASTVRARLSPEQVYELEERMIEALTRWVEDGNVSNSEAGNVVTELAVLLLTHHRLLDAAQLLIRYSWLSFKFGHGPHLALIAQDVLLRFDWHSTNEYECAVLVLVQILLPLLGKPVETKKYINYQPIRDGFLTGKIAIQADIESYVTHLLLLDAMSTVQFEEAQTILNAYRSRLAARQTIHLEQHPALLTEQAYLLGKQCEYLEEQGEHQKACRLRDQTITLYRRRVALYSSVEGEVPLNREHRKQALGYYLSHLAYHLNRAGLNEEALQVIDRAIALQEQGCAYIGVLATSYNDKSQILVALGRFREALLFNEKALAEVQRCIHAGDGISQEEIPIYAVNRGRLYLRLGRINEAEQILQEALPCISAPRRKYGMFAKEALEEIRQWRQRTVTSQHQLDWRWVGRFRDLSAHSSTWWLTWAGPFTEEEQHEWDRLFVFPFDEAVKAPLEQLMKISRERELEAAIREQREPRLRYPALPIEEIQREINGLQQLGEDVRQQEPNAIVRRFYQEVIEEELDYLCLLEATSEENTERFWEYNLRLFPLPGVDEMNYAFAHIKSLLRQGAVVPEVASVSQQVEEMLQTHFHLSYDLGQDDMEEWKGPSVPPDNATPTEAEPERKISAQAVKRFFESVLQGSGYNEWRVVIDLNATGARVSPGPRQLILPEQQFTLAEVQHLFLHEFAGHAARFMAGEHSLLGLLGIHTRNYLPTEEGLALYHECQEARRHGRAFNDEGLRWMTFAVGLASGVMTPPQTFLALFTFLEALTFLHGRLRYPHVERQKTQVYARTYALSLCLRIYRGVPDLNRAGICFLQDALYFHGLRQIERAVAEDETVLERLAVGACALEDLPALQELGIIAPPPSLRKLAAASDLDAYIVSFDEPEKQRDEHV